jgi:phytoene dehydrogenase-like protein
MSSKATLTASVIGSGPNGLSAAIVLAAAGLATTVFERNAQIGGACSTAETTLPDFSQDLGSSVYPMGVASPFFRSLPVNIPWIEPTAPCAHPLDDGTAVMLEHSIEATVATLDTCDASKYRSLIAPVTSNLRNCRKTFLGQFSTSRATHLYSRASLPRRFNRPRRWLVLISPENALKPSLPVWRRILSFPWRPQLQPPSL